MLRSVAAEVAVAAGRGVEVAIVVGGGNYFRGVDAWDGLDRATADHMGMLATCMNAICLQVCPMHLPVHLGAIFATLLSPYSCVHTLRLQVMCCWLSINLPE